MQLCSSKELISFDRRSFLMKTHLSSFVRIIFDPNGSSFPRKLMLFSHEKKSPLQVRFLLGLLPKLWGKLLKAPICFRTQTCQFVQRYLLCEFSSILVCCFFAISDQHLEMWNCISHDCKICKLVYAAAQEREKWPLTTSYLFPIILKDTEVKILNKYSKDKNMFPKLQVGLHCCCSREREVTTDHLLFVPNNVRTLVGNCQCKEITSHYMSLQCNPI